MNFRRTAAALAALALLPVSALAVTTATGTSASAATTPLYSTSSETLASGRTYQLRTDRNRTTPVPLVVALHGYGQTAADMSAGTGLSTYADSHNFALAYGHAYDNAAWNSGEGLDTTPQDDVTYLRQVVADAAKKTPIDLNRVYVWGHSNGGMMAARALCEAGDVFAAGASMAGPLAAQVAGDCDPNFNFYKMHGTADTTVPLFGGVGVNNVNFAPGWNDGLRKGATVSGVFVLNPRVGAGHEWASIANMEFINFSLRFTNTPSPTSATPTVTTN